MQTLLNDIELDIQELKCLVQAVSDNSNPALRTVAKRNIRQMQMRLDALSDLLEEPIVAVPVESVTSAVVELIPEEELLSEEPILVQSVPEESISEEPIKVIELSEPTPVVSAFASSPTSPILAECIKPAKDLRHAISLNDSFRFTRELFDGDSARMNEVVRQLGETSSLNQALDVFNSMVHVDEENVAVADFLELLKKYFS